ncbi:MAG TPA: HAMP domain-containing sensor histidine kinase [Gemmatimonadaceae bacterium]|nr:HAMP domain-containing sensor histidine kinase [Gemmatimonadaceae bacterium]
MALGVFASARRSRSGLLVALLFLTLGLAAVLAHQAYDATRDHRATAERTLRDYASTAAWEFNAHAKEELWQALAYAFRPCKAIETTIARFATLPPPDILAAEAKKLEACSCTLVLDTDYYFLLDFRNGSTRFAGASAPAIGPEWLKDTVTAHAKTSYERGWEFATIFHGTGPHARTIVYTLKRDHAGAPVAAYGFVMDPQRFGEAAYTRVMKKWALLPYALTGGLPNDSLLRLSVVSASGDEIYGSAADFDDAISGVAEWKPFFGGMMTHVALRPEAAERLVIGGLPRSRLPLLMGVLAMTAALIVVAVVQLRREAELARLRSDFVSSVSHELRTPLAQIRMFAETLLLGRVRSDAERVRSMEIIDQEARRLAHLVENVLHFSRAERQSLRLCPVPTLLAPQVREIAESFGPIARARKVDVRLALDETVAVRVDRNALRQMLLNLLDNAVKYGPPGQTVTIGVRGSGDRARIWVEDEGPGIDPAESERIFEPFFRIDRDANSAVGGSGIGLSVVRELASMHAGRAYAEEGERGARFVIDLERVPYESEAVAMPEDEPGYRNGAVVPGDASRHNVQV